MTKQPETEQEEVFNLTDKIIAFEDGQLDKQETIELFQQLINTGMAWTLQGHYGRTAMDLIRGGHCKLLP